MEFVPSIAMVAFINITLILTFLGLGLYSLMLLIRALKSYVNKNS